MSKSVCSPAAPAVVVSTSNSNLSPAEKLVGSFVNTAGVAAVAVLDSLASMVILVSKIVVVFLWTSRTNELPDVAVVAPAATPWTLPAAGAYHVTFTPVVASVVSLPNFQLYQF